MEISTFKLQNNIELYVHNSPLYTHTALQFNFYSYNDEDNAAKTITNMLLMEGCEKYPTRQAIALAAEKEYGASISSSSSTENGLHNICYNISVLTKEALVSGQKTLENMVSLMVSIIANPLLYDEGFMAKHLDIKRKELLLAEKRKKMDKDSIAARGFMEAAIGKCIYTMDIAGTEDDILKVSHADCSQAYLRQLFEMPKKIFAGTNLEPGYLAGIVEKSFGCMPRTDTRIVFPDAPEKKGHSRKEKEFPCDQSLIFAGIPFNIPDSTKEKRALNMLTFYLGGYGGGRLFTEIRLKRDMAYGAYASIDPHLGIIYGHAGIDRANKDAVVDIMLKEFRKASKGKIPKSGFERAKSYLINQRKMNLHSKAMKLNAIESAALQGRLDELKDYEQAYLDITYENVIQAASRLKYAPIIYCLLQQEKK